MTEATSPTLDLDLHPAQMDFTLSESPIRALVGGIGSGKSFAGALDLLLRVQPHRLYMVTAPTYPMLRDATLRTVLALARRLGFLRGLARSEMTVHLNSGAEILFRSTDEPDRLRGPNISGVWMDEASLSTLEAYHVLIGRLREAGQRGWLSATFTPRGKGNWTFEVFGKLRSGVGLFHARTADNPFLPPGFVDQLRTQYTSAHAEQELEGLFTDLSGTLFQRHWFPIVESAPAGLARCRFWDLAGSESRSGRDPDWTAGVLMGRDRQGRYPILDVRRVRATSRGVEELVRQTAQLDGTDVPIRMEQEPGSSGLAVIDHYLRTVLPGWDFAGVRSTGDKATRARPLAAQAEAGNVLLVRAPWNKDFLDEFETFPGGVHDDMVDAASGAFSHLAGTFIGVPLIGTGQRQTSSAPPGVFGTGDARRMPRM